MLIVALLILVAPLLYKAWYIDNFIVAVTATRFLGFSQVIANDALFYCTLFSLLYLSLLPAVNRWLSALFRLLALLLFVVYVADFCVILYFNVHLSIGDALKYAKFAYPYVQQTYGLGAFSIFLISAALLVAALAFAFSRYKINTPRCQKLSLLVLASLPLAACFADDQKYVHSWIYKNVVNYNLTILSESSAYSDRFVQSFNYPEASHCQTENAEHKNIILLMVESLSAYQSQYFSGIHNWTPNLDLIASQNLAYKNFYANGFITEDGEIALLTGLQPIYPPAGYSVGGNYAFDGFFNIADALPQILKKHGYQTDFLTSADLEFGNTGNWAKSIGFDYVEGHEHPDYDHWERFQFHAAPDEALYLRALDRMKTQRGKNFFMFIKTVSSHHPYLNPENKHKSESETFQYVDKQIGRFYAQLQKNGFFNNGLLLIIGDHHAMTTLKKAEFEVYGQYKAGAKIPLVVADGKQQGVENHQYQQIDLFNSLQGMVTGQQCYTDWQGILWGEHKISPKFIAHRRGDNRDVISIFTENADYQVKMDGDATRLLGNHAADQGDTAVFVHKINALRIARLKQENTHLFAEKPDLPILQPATLAH